ncbi:porin [Paraburkholderia sp. SIMBA_053]|uniref:porin n=1 Tax=Paraburkholderia sp. SIMBA_053 TaxID=3085794 RepID=UPI0039795666
MKQARWCSCGALAASLFAMQSSSAWAQSSVTLYGIVDAVIDISNQGKGTLVREMSGAPLGSRFGLKGSEDLGGGYKSIFTLEDGFGVNNGAIQQGGLFWGRQAWLGISGPTGTLTFGRQYSPEFWAFAGNDPFELGLAGGLSDISRTLPNGSVTGLLNGYIATSRTSNSAVYMSPEIHGLTVRLMYGFGGVPGSMRDGSTVSAGVYYTTASFAFNGGYVRNVKTDGTGEYIAYTIGGTYTVGPARIYVNYARDTDTTANTATKAGPKVQYGLASVGLRYQIRPDIQADAQVEKIIDTSEGHSPSQNAYVESLALIYSLSKRTTLYTSYGQVQSKHAAAYSLGAALYFGGAATPGSTGRTFQLGIRTLF